MRGSQLAEIVKTFHGRRYDVRFSPITDSFRSSRLFLTKGAAKVVSSDLMSGWKASGNTLLVDLVDEKPAEGIMRFADRLVASSVTAFREYSRLYPETEVVLVNHHVDPRITRTLTNRSTAESKAGYFGETVNAVLGEEIERVVTPVHIDTSQQGDDSWLHQLSRFDLHYAVRNERELDHFKPFLKGFTAAHCRSNIVIQRSQVEAIEWLGDDYPYLVDSSGSVPEIVQTVERALSDRGTRRWDEALSRMNDIRVRTSPERIAAEFIRAIG